MKKLEKFLLNFASEITLAEKTNSKYFIKDNVKIRYSDHISSNIDLFDIQIVKSSEACDFYTVIFNNSSRIVCWRTNKIIEFIPYFVLLTSLNKEAPKNLEEAEFAKAIVPEVITSDKLDLIASKIDTAAIKLNNEQIQLMIRDKRTWSNSELDKVSSLIYLEFGTTKGFTGDFRLFLRNNPVTYLEFITMFNYFLQKQEKPTIKLIKGVAALYNI